MLILYNGDKNITINIILIIVTTSVDDSIIIIGYGITIIIGFLS